MARILFSLFLATTFTCIGNTQNTYLKTTSEYLPGNPDAVSISTDNGTEVIVASKDGTIKKFDPRTNIWNGYTLQTTSRSGLISGIKARKVEHVGKGYLVLDRRGYTHLVINEKIVNSYGKAKDITGGGKKWFKIDDSGNIHEYDGNLNDEWKLMKVQPPVPAKSIEASRWDNPWITANNGDIYRYVGRSKTWSKVKGRAAELFISPKDEVYMIHYAQLVGGGGKLYKYNEKSKKWENHSSYTKSLAPFRNNNTFYQVDEKGRVLKVEEKEVSYVRTEKEIKGILGRKIFHSKKGDLAVIDKNYQLHFYEYNPAHWTPYPLKDPESNRIIKPVDLALSNRVMFHVLDDQSNVWRVFANNITKETGKALDIAFGNDNRTYKISFDHRIYYKNGIFETWEAWTIAPPVKPIKIAVSQYRNPWIVTEDYSIYRFIGRTKTWQKVDGSASDVIITPSSEVYKLSVVNLVGGGNVLGKYNQQDNKWDNIYGYARSVTAGNDRNEYIVCGNNYEILYKTGWVLEDYCPDRSFCPELFAEVFDVKIRSYIPPRFTMLGGSNFENMVSVVNNEYLTKGCRYSVHTLKQAIENNKTFDEVFMDLLVAWSDQWGGGVSFAKNWVASQVAGGVCDLVDGGNDCESAVSAVTLVAIDAALIYLGLPTNLPDARQLREDGIEYIASEVASYTVLNANNAAGEYIPPAMRAEVMKIAHDITESELKKKLEEYVPNFNTDEEDPSTWGIPASIYAPHNAKLYIEISIKNREVYEAVLGMDYDSWPYLKISDEELIYRPKNQIHFPIYLPENRIVIPVELLPFPQSVSTSDRVPNSIPGIDVSRDWIINKFGVGRNFASSAQKNMYEDTRYGEWSDWDQFYIKSNETTFNLTADFSTKSGTALNLKTRPLDKVNLNVAWVWDQKTGIGILETKRVNNEDVKVLKNYYGRLDPPARCDGKDNIRWFRH